MTPPAGQKEAFSRVVIDAQLKDVGWNLTDGQSVRYEYQLPDGTFADYVLSDRHGRAMAVVEAKRAASISRKQQRRVEPMPNNWVTCPTSFSPSAMKSCSGIITTKPTRILSAPSSSRRTSTHVPTMYLTSLPIRPDKIGPLRGLPEE